MVDSIAPTLLYIVKAVSHNGVEKYTWEYTDTGVTKSHTDKENGLKYTYDYDSVGRLIRQEIQNLSGTHVGSTEVNYDVRNNVTKIATEFGGYTASDVYLYSSNSGNANASSYAKDNLVSRYKINDSSSRYIDYSYDGLNRLTKKSFVFDSTTKNTEYTYWDSNRGSGYTTTQLDTEKLDNTIYKYYYDNVGNITSITKNSGAYRSYTYDNKNQLTKEVNSTSGITTSFTYDSLGNITKKVESGNSNKTINYSYGNNGKTGWNNLLTGVDLSGNGVYESNETISYDNIGNPTTYLGASLTWFGRQLKSYTINSQTVNYTYDADGLRSSKSALGVNCTYQYVGGQLRYETRGAHRFYYYYDASGNLSAIRYYDANGTASIYFVLTNAQGDVKSIYSKAGVLVASYEYDAFGNCTITQDTTGIGALNPIRYRGYYYDSETGFYYLQSRYYNPKVGRFLNSDNITDSNAGVLGYNTFLYCGNNPVNASDPTGHWIIKDAIKWIASKVSLGINKIKEKTANSKGTYQIGVAGSAACITEVTGAFGVAADSHGNIALTISGGGAGTPNVSIGVFSTITEAPTIKQLEGESFQVGGSINVPYCSVGAEYTAAIDSATGEIYSGYTGSCSLSVSLPVPAEIHTDITTTKILSSVNIFDSIDEVCIEIMEW